MYSYDLKEIEDEIYWCYEVIFDARGYTLEEIEKNYETCRTYAWGCPQNKRYFSREEMSVVDHDLLMIIDSLIMLGQHERLTSRYDSKLSNKIVFDISLEEIRLRDGVFVSTLLASLKHQIERHSNRLTTIVSRLENKGKTLKYGGGL